MTPPCLSNQTEGLLRRRIASRDLQAALGAPRTGTNHLGSDANHLGSLALLGEFCAQDEEEDANRIRGEGTEEAAESRSAQLSTPVSEARALV